MTTVTMTANNYDCSVYSILLITSTKLDQQNHDAVHHNSLRVPDNSIAYIVYIYIGEIVTCIDEAHYTGGPALHMRTGCSKLE